MVGMDRLLDLLGLLFLIELTEVEGTDQCGEHAMKCFRTLA
jgi:hypothetical protein